MALNRYIWASVRRLERAEQWEKEARRIAERVIKRENLRANNARVALVERKNAEEREAKRQQYLAAQAELGRLTCPHCDRFYPATEIDAHVLACQEVSAQPECPLCHLRMPAKRLDYHVAKCGVGEWWAQGS